jgi:hypothetical protein
MRQLPHCLTEESYLGRRGCLMGNLTFQEISDPLTQRRRVLRFWDIIHSKAFLCKPDPSEIPGSLRGHAPKPGPGAGPWPQRSAQPALARRDGESFRERRGTHRNAWFPSSRLRVRRLLLPPRHATLERACAR